MEESSGWKTERGSPHRSKQIPETMPASWRREVDDEVENAVFGRDDEDMESEEPMATIDRILRRAPSNEPGSTDMAYDSDSDDESDHDHAFVTTTMLAPATTPTPSLVLPLPVRSSSQSIDVY